jgi:hypothetical protein
LSASATSLRREQEGLLPLETRPGLARVNRLVVRLSPLGLFAIAGHTVGTLDLEQVAHLRVFRVAWRTRRAAIGVRKATRDLAQGHLSSGARMVDRAIGGVYETLGGLRGAEDLGK